MIRRIKRWRTLRLLCAAEQRAYVAWRIARHSATDMHMIYRDSPSPWRRGGEIDRANQAERDAHAAYTQARSVRERYEETFFNIR